MIKAQSDELLPRHIRLDAATACQLKCPSCPTASGETGKRLGRGFLKFADFKRLIDENPWVSHIELSNWGEIFLNKELPQILRYAYRHNVAMHAGNGANLNTVSQEALEAVVKYRLRVITCSIDGASQETYVQYRVNGDFNTVIANINEINRLKKKYNSPFPKLRWQFVVFGHNEHEIDLARRMAAQLNMEFFPKLSWDDLYTKEFSPVRDRALVSKETGLGVASREEFRQTFGHEYVELKCCFEIWQYPQINIDGRVLGCSVNYWGDFGNAFKDGLKESLNSESIRYARKMLKGEVPPKKGIPCTSCKIYHRLQKSGNWAKENDTRPPPRSSRFYNMIEMKVLGKRGIVWAERLYRGLKDPRWAFEKTLERTRHALRPPQRKDFSAGTIQSGVHQLRLPQPADSQAGWKAYPKFRGKTAFLESFSAHSSVLIPGFCPHPPHEHKDEEILIMLSGEARLVLPGLQTGDGPKPVTLKAGQFVYYPAHFLHTLSNGIHAEANYLMFKWYGQAHRRNNRLGYGFYDTAEFFSSIPATGFHTATVFEGPTENLSKLHAHVTTLAPGAGYPPHTDPYDVAIIMLEGAVETLGKWAQGRDVIFYKAGEPHGIHNPGSTAAKYLVFEFHG